MIDASVMQTPGSPAEQPGRCSTQRGGIIAWLAMCFFLFFGCLVMTGVFVAHSIKVHESSGNNVQVDTPFGSVHVKHGLEGRPESAGIPLYPGARARHNSESASIDLSEIFGQKDLHIVAGKWETSDPIAKVQKFYKEKFPDMSISQKNGQIEMHSIDGHAKRFICLRRVGNGSATEIALASVGEPKAN